MIVRSIQFIARSAEVLALHESLLRPLRVLRGRVAPPYLLRSGSGKQQRLKVAVYKREFFDVVRAKIERNISTVGFELRYFTSHFDRLRDLANLQLRIDARRRIHLHQDVWHRISLETRCLDFDPIGVGDQVDNGIISAIICRGFISRVLRHRCHSDLGPRYRIALRVRHRANDASVHRLARCRASAKPKRETKN